MDYDNTYEDMRNNYEMPIQPGAYTVNAPTAMPIPEPSCSREDCLSSIPPCNVADGNDRRHGDGLKQRTAKRKRTNVKVNIVLFALIGILLGFVAALFILHQLGRQKNIDVQERIAVLEKAISKANEKIAYFRRYNNETNRSPLNWTLDHEAAFAKINNSIVILRHDFIEEKRQRLRENIRLADGGAADRGRVEVYHDGRWGTVCDYGWDMKDADVTCRLLGFHGALSANLSAAFGRGNGKIWLDDVRCAGDELSLSLCAHNGWGNHSCRHYDDASVICKQ